MVGLTANGGFLFDKYLSSRKSPFFCSQEHKTAGRKCSFVNYEGDHGRKGGELINDKL